MLFKPELIGKIKAGKKTQTRRPVRGVNLAVDKSGNPGATDSPFFAQIGPIEVVMTEKGRAIYEVGKTYAICPGRGKPQVARYKLLKIRYEDVRNISDADAMAEGFSDRQGFWKVWVNFYDPYLQRQTEQHGDGVYYLDERPANLYTAWALTFELCR